eukprot:2892713-Lingulodinium_polyedra.AAC.1
MPGVKDTKNGDHDAHPLLQGTVQEQKGGYVHRVATLGAQLADLGIIPAFRGVLRWLTFAVHWGRPAR